MTHWISKEESRDDAQRRAHNAVTTELEELVRLMREDLASAATMNAAPAKLVCLAEMIEAFEDRLEVANKAEREFNKTLDGAVYEGHTADACAATL